VAGLFAVVFILKGLAPLGATQAAVSPARNPAIHDASESIGVFNRAGSIDTVVTSHGLG
jgi:hypothetical protein